MKDLVIGDVHFGIKNNNLTWLNLQKKFLQEDVMSLINSHDRVIFLGDVFDIRYSVNTQVGCAVKDIVREMLKSNQDKQFYFIAGNHDYYSPVMDFEEMNAYELVFGKEFIHYYKNLHIISSVPYIDNRTLMLPWYFTENDERYEQVMKEYRGQFDIIYCHTDLEHWPIEKANLKGDATVYSGHIHYPWVSKEMKLWNLGASCSFTFNDVNATRCIYTIEDGIIVKTYENNITPKFYRYFNDRIFSLTKDDFQNAYVQLCISTKNKDTAMYKEQIAALKKEYSGTAYDIKVVAVDEDIMRTLEGGIDFNTNIHDYIKNNIPSHLKCKYEILNKRLIDKE